MVKPDTWYAYFCLKGSFAPDDLTRRLRVIPTETASEGDPIKNSSKRRLCSLWALYSRLQQAATLEEQVNDILDQLDSDSSEFQQASRELDGTMQLVGFFHQREPGVSFDQETVRRIAQYGLSIDCDFYNYAHVAAIEISPGES